MDRRSLLKLAAAAAPLAFSGKLFAAPAARGTRLLVVFLRGAYDAVNVTIPLSDFYTRSRPTIGIARPDAANPLAALPLDADWGLHPALKDSLYPLWAKRQLAFVPFAGTDDMTRSHFETQDTIELGQPIGASRNYGSGFMARLADTLSAGSGAPSPIAFTDQVPLSFRGGTPIPNIALGGVGKPAIDDRQAKLIAAMYAGDGLAKSVSQGFAVRNEVYQSLAGQEPAANRGAVSPKGFELSARRMGRLMATDFTLGFVDVGGWDTHVNQGGATGYLAGRLNELGTGLAGFVEEIGPAAWNDTVVVVVSEFGRTFRENGDKGTDHGHGSSYWVMGGGVKGGRFAGPQVALSEASLNQARDLPVLTDYRALMGGLFARMYGLGGDRLTSVFPGTAPSDLRLI